MVFLSGNITRNRYSFEGDKNLRKDNLYQYYIPLFQNYNL